MVLSAASCATPLSKHSVYPWEAHGSSLAETRILTEKTSPSVSERAAQRIRDRNRRLVHLCIWKKAQRGKGSACPGHGRRAGERGQPSPHCGCRGSAARLPPGEGPGGKRGESTLRRGGVSLAERGWSHGGLSVHGRGPAALPPRFMEPRAAHSLPPPPPGHAPPPPPLSAGQESRQSN